MKLHYSKRTYPFRSPGLFVFLTILKDAYPGWVDMADIEARLPHIHPRQLARFVDLLEAAGLQLVRYETKTRGRFQLAVKPESIVLSGDQSPHTRSAPATSDLFTPVANVALSAYQDKAWVAWVIALLHSTLALHEGHLSGKDGALDYLDTAEAASSSLPLWTASVVHVRRAFLLNKESRYREATFWLRRVDTAVRHGHAHPAAKTEAQLVRAKMRYDQARYAEAEQLLGESSTAGSAHHPSWLNMNALTAGRKFLASNDTDAPVFLHQTLSALAEALGYVFLSHGDSSLLDGLCYNFANNLLRGIKRGVIPVRIIGDRPRFLAPRSSRHLQFNFLSRSGRQRDQHVQTELLELAAYQVGDARLRDAEHLRGFCLCPLLVADQDFESAHEFGAHGEDGCLFRRESEVDENVAAGFGDFEFFFFHFALSLSCL